MNKHKVIKIFRPRLTAVFIIMTLVATGFVMAGCATQAVDKAQVSGEGIRTVLVLRFVDMAALYGHNQGVRSPISGQAFVTGPVEDKACDFLTGRIMGFLKDKTKYVPVPYEDAQGAVTQVADQNAGDVMSAKSVLAIGRKLGVDAVAAGHVYRFRERVGKGYSVDTPASVAFDLTLLRVSDGRILWSGRYDETQRPLSENLFDFSKFIKRGGAWVTAEQLASAGLEQALSSFP